MSADFHFSQAVRALSNLHTLSQSSYPSDANIEYLQRQLYTLIDIMVSTNRDRAYELSHGARIRQAIAAGNITVRPYLSQPVTPILSREPALKTKVIAKKKLEEPCPAECAICQETPKFKDAVCTDCEHYYCKPCWTGWMNADGSNKSCPTCRKDLPGITSYRARASPKPATRRPTAPLETLFEDVREV